jgi:uncharacterized repeat protein (TIGR01451 family)
MNVKNKKKNLAVSEVVGAILLLAIAVTTFSIISYYILSADTPDDGPIVEISGTFSDNNVILTHKWGESLALNTEVFLTWEGHNDSIIVGDFLDSESRENGLWDLGEKIYYPVADDFDYEKHPNIEVMLVDENGKNLVFIGNVVYVPSCDISLYIYTNNSFPRENEIVNLTVSTCNNCKINTSGVVVEFILPEGLDYLSNFTTNGIYNNVTGIWNIDKIAPGQCVNLSVIARCRVFDNPPLPTQLVLILDGSDSISPPSWILMKKGISTALADGGFFPHDGSSEITIVQFGGKTPAYAQLDISPTIISESNVNDVRSDIEDIIQIGGKTPTSCGVYLAADALKQSHMFDPDIRQILILVTDGNPTHCCDCCEGDYLDDQCSDANGPKNEVVSAVDYAINLLNLTTDQDEFDAFAVELMGEGHSVYLVEDIVWPFPGYYVPPFNFEPHRGWVRNVSSWEEFGYALNESFGYLYNNAFIKASIKSSVITDPVLINNEGNVKITILPKFA